MLKKLSKKIIRKSVYAVKYLRRSSKVNKFGSQLLCVQDNTGLIKPSDIIVLCTLRNEGIRIPYFLKYYRDLGASHFIFIDNGSTDDFMALVGDQKDCSVWYTTASYKASNFGVYWQNFLLSRYGSGHWCVTVDPDEFLVFPYMDTRRLRDLIAYLEGEKREHMFSILLDLYPEGPVAEAIYHTGQDPLEVCRHFDRGGYSQRPQAHNGDVWVQGGVRRRVFFADRPQSAPALNKTVLVKWRKHYAYLSSTHVASPRRLNAPHARNGIMPTGCLLHFKYLALFTEKVAEEMQRGEHYAGSVEYRSYFDRLNAGETSLCYPGSVKYQDWRQLVDLGLMNTGMWF